MVLDAKDNKNIIKLWLGNFISNIGDAIYLIVLPWMILDILEYYYQMIGIE